MIRKFSAVLLLVSIMAMCSLTVSAEHYWNYDIKFQAAHGTINIDGKADAGEWDDAPAIEIKLNNDPMDARGHINYQGEWSSGRDDSDYSGVYKVKWDSEYIYFFEDRTDNHVNLSGSAEQPWMTDGTLVFTQADSADGALNGEGVSIHVFYIVGNGNSAVGGQVMARVCNMLDGSRETIEIPGAKIASSIKGGGFIVEIAVPWSFYKEYTPRFTPGAGTIMGLSYVVHDGDADEPNHEKQLCYAIDNDMLGDVPGGYDFGGWGTLELLAAPVVALPAEVPADVPAAAQTPAAPAPAPAAAAAPRTGDASVFIALSAVIALGGIAIVRKRAAR